MSDQVQLNSVAGIFKRPYPDARIHPDLVEERELKIATHARAHPPWWRVFAVRRWLAVHRSLTCVDVSMTAWMLRQAYPASTITEMAERKSFLLENLARLKENER